jgi:hypothetical protein
MDFFYHLRLREPIDRMFHSLNYYSFIHDDIIDMSSRFVYSVEASRIQFKLLRSFNFNALSFSLAGNFIAKVESLTILNYHSEQAYSNSITVYPYSKIRHFRLLNSN